jgi:hypothetical protein
LTAQKTWSRQGAGNGKTLIMSLLKARIKDHPGNWRYYKAIAALCCSKGELETAKQFFDRTYFIKSGGIPETSRPSCPESKNIAGRPIPTTLHLRSLRRWPHRAFNCFRHTNRLPFLQITSSYEYLARNIRCQFRCLSTNGEPNVKQIPHSKVICRNARPL